MRPHLQILDDSLVDRILDETYSVLETTGILVDSPEGFDRLRELGLPADESTKRVRFPRDVVARALDSAPS